MKDWQNTGVLATLILGTLLMSGCILSNPLNIYNTFNNSVDNYSLQYPSDWKIDSSNTTVYLTNGGAEVKIQSESIAPNTTLEEYVQSHIPDPNKFYGSGWLVIDLKQTDMTFKGLPAKKVTYDWVGASGGNTSPKEFMYFIRGDRIYTVSYIAHSAEFYNLQRTAQKIIDSLTFDT